MYIDTCNLLLYVLISSKRLSIVLPLIDAFIALMVCSVSFNTSEIKYYIKYFKY